MLESNTISGIEGSLRNRRLGKSLPRRLKRKRHYTAVDINRLLVASASTATAPKYLIFKRKEDDFMKTSPNRNFLIEKSVTTCVESLVTNIGQNG